jgi:hypothetical protein
LAKAKALVEREFIRSFAPYKDDNKRKRRPKGCALVEREFIRSFAPYKDDN